MSPEIKIGDRIIGGDQPCYVIAEAGVNHNGEVGLAHDLIDAAVDAGADAVKFQAFIAGNVVTDETAKAGYQIQTTGDKGGQLEMLKALELAPQDHAELKKHCEQQAVEYLCTPYDAESVDMLAGIGVTAFKIASTDTTNVPFLRYVGGKKKPVILSTGMCALDEVEEGVAALRAGGCVDVMLLQCISEYPAPPEESNLRVMESFRKTFDVPTGYSDHSAGIGVAPWAVAAGAKLLEKHLTLNRALSGPDHRASLEPGEFKDLVTTIRLVEAALGDGVKRVAAVEASNKAAMQRSVVARHALSAGTVLAESDLTYKRPGTGLPPKWIDRIVGATLRHPVAADQQIGLDDLTLPDD